MIRRHLEEKLHSERIDLDDLLKEFHRCWIVIRRTRAAIELVSSFLSDSSVEYADKLSDGFSGRRSEKCAVEGGEERLLVSNWQMIM